MSKAAIYWKRFWLFLLFLLLFFVPCFLGEVVLPSIRRHFGVSSFPFNGICNMTWGWTLFGMWHVQHLHAFHRFIYLDFAIYLCFWRVFPFKPFFTPSILPFFNPSFLQPFHPSVLPSFLPSFLPYCISSLFRNQDKTWQNKQIRQTRKITKYRSKYRFHSTGIAMICPNLRVWVHQNTVYKHMLGPRCGKNWRCGTGMQRDTRDVPIRRAQCMMTSFWGTISLAKESSTLTPNWHSYLSYVPHHQQPLNFMRDPFKQRSLRLGKTGYHIKAGPT